MKALVTGGAGFIGSHLTDRLVAEGHDVTVLDDLSTGTKSNINPRARFVRAQLESFDFGPRERFDVVFHLAALARIQPSIVDPVAAHRVNVLGSLRLFQAAIEWQARVVFSSSSSIYGDADRLPLNEADDKPRPASPYALQKLMCEQYLDLFSRMHGLDAIALRYFNVYGERQILTGRYAAVVGIFLAQRASGEPFTIVGDGEQRRDFTYVGDIVDANVRAAAGRRKNAAFEVVNVGSGSNVSMNELADAIDRFHPRVFLPSRLGDARATLADNGKAMRMLEWQPTTRIQDWIARTMRKTA